jgi:protease-4
MGEVAKVLGTLVGMPLHALGQLAHGMATGSAAVVEVVVDAKPGVLARARWLERLRGLAGDPNIAAVLLELREPPGNWAAVHDLRAVIRYIRESGKPVYAYVEVPTNATFWLASACERIFVPPTSEVGLVGLGIEVTFFGALLERLGLETDFEAAGAYKSAAEPFSRSYASPANYEALSSLVDDLQDLLVGDIADARGLSTEAVREAMASAPLAASAAVERELVDQLAYDDEVRTWVIEAHENASFVPFSSWSRRSAVLAHLAGLGQSDGTVAILHLEGNIVEDDQSGGAAIRSRSVVPLIRQLREDDSIAAVVLHVNSPGGSALASDLIWREVDQLREVKPVVACYEDVSASGGVYLSAPATEIVVRPGTLTGSIGVVGGKLVVADGLRKLGVHSQRIDGAPNATVFSSTRRFTPEQRVRFRASLSRFYDAFVQRVADGRNRDPAEIEPHCQGRVWTGRAAKERGLVDRLGDLEVAIERASALSGLEGRRVARRHLSGTPQDPIQTFIRQSVRRALPGAARVNALLGRGAGELGAVAQLWVSETGRPLAWLPWTFRLR